MGRALNEGRDRTLTGRRAFCQALLRASVASLVSMSTVGGRRGIAYALGRIPVASRLSFSIPWPLERLDPHDSFDPIAALFAHAVADPVFSLDAGGDPYPALAAEPASVKGNRTFVKLRQGLITARGRPLLAVDVAFSIRRGQAAGGYAYWADLPFPALVRGDKFSLSFATTDAARISRTLASPLFAVVPRSFDPAQPDGTGGMRADFSAGRLILSRNTKAARGASYLGQVVVDQAPDLSASLRAFEGDSTDLGWLGAGLHTPRPGAVAFDAGSAGFVVLRTGNEAGAWGAPGVAQQIIDSVPRERLQHLGLGEMTAEAGRAIDWGGPRCDLYFPQGSAQLAEIAGIVALLISRPGHEVEARPLPWAELVRRRANGSYALMIHVVRAPGGPGLPALIALTAAVDPKAALDAQRHPPRLASFSPRALTRTLRLGVLGELRVTGAVAPGVFLAKGPEGWDLSSSYRTAGARRLP